MFKILRLLITEVIVMKYIRIESIEVVALLHFDTSSSTEPYNWDFTYNNEYDEYK